MIYLGLLSCFFKKVWWFFSKLQKIFVLVCDCMKLSSNYVMKFLLKINSLKTLLIKAEELLVLLICRKIVY